jgi:hypothetical protein
VINILLAEVKVKRNVRFYATGMLQRERVQETEVADASHMW